MSSADFVISGLVQRGVPLHLAQGIAMNGGDESGFDPTAVGDNGNAFGLFQWNGPRMRSLYDYAAKAGGDPADPNLQLDFLMYELNGPESKAWTRMQGATTPGEAAAIFLNDFERPAESHRARREAAYLGGAAPSYTGGPAQTYFGGQNALATGYAPPQQTNALAGQPQFRWQSNALDPRAFMTAATNFG